MDLTLTRFAIKKSESGRDESTELDGTVVDMNGARLPKAVVDAVSIRGEKYVTQTADDGTSGFLVPQVFIAFAQVEAVSVRRGERRLR